MRVQKCLGVGVLVLSLGLLVPGEALAQGERNAVAHFGLGVATAALNFIYGPVKVGYAVLGTVTGGLAWIVTGGNNTVVRRIIQPAVRGDYAIVPENLTNEKRLVFSGHDPEEQLRY